MDKENFLKAVKNEKDSTIVENQWTTDGQEHFGYGGSTRGKDNEAIEKEKKTVNTSMGIGQIMVKNLSSKRQTVGRLKTFGSLIQ